MRTTTAHPGTAPAIGPAGIALRKLTRTAWIDAAAQFEDHGYRQSWDFGIHAASRVRATSEHVELRSGDRTVALADVRIKRIPFLGAGIAYVTGGPLTRRGGRAEPEVFLAAVESLREEYAVRRGLVLRIAPPLGEAAWSAGVAAGLAERGFAPAPSPAAYETMLVAVDRPEDEIRRAFHQKWRNCLNRAEREGIDVRIGHDTRSLERFADLFDRFVARKDLSVRLDAAFHVAVQRDLPACERFVVFLAESEGSVIAGLVASLLGDTAVYLLGATSPEALTRKAAYLLQWHAIRAARARGCRWWDLGGVNAAENPGVYHFKQGLGGATVTAPAPVEWHSGARSRLALALESRLRAAQGPSSRQARP